MKMLAPGDVLDGFAVQALVHSGGMAHIYRVHYADGRPDPGFVMAMKVPRMAGGDGAENLVGFEVEQQLLQALTGEHVPRFVAAGDMARLPWLVMEYIPGRTLQQVLDDAQAQHRRPDAQAVARLGQAVATAAHSLHEQNAVHLDLKPANVLLQGDGRAVLLDFGLSWHAHYPDLLAEELRQAVGSPAWMAPEQVVGIRGDPRSDIFAIGVMLYELATGELPFGAPETAGGLRQRLWMQPRPPRSLNPQVPAWLQEIILRCLEPVAAQRYPSAAHLAFDLAHPQQVNVTERGERLRGAGFSTHLKRWLRAAGMQYEPSPLPSQRIREVPIVMVAVPHRDTTDATLYSLRQAVNRSLGIRPGARLACVSVIAPVGAGDDESAMHREHLERLRQWAQGLHLEGHQASFHVIESGDVARALVTYARGNHVDLLVLGAATHGLQMQRLVATVPMRVVMDAPCSVLLVRQALPFSALAHAQADEQAGATIGA